MNFENLLVIDAAPSTSPAASERLKSHSALAGYSITALAETGLAQYLLTAAEEGGLPAIVFIDRRVSNLNRLMALIERLSSPSHVFILEQQAEPSERPGWRMSLLPADVHWSEIHLGDPRLAEIVSREVAAARGRWRLQSTLERANRDIEQARKGDADRVHRGASLSDYYLKSFLANAEDAIVALDTRLRVLYWSAGAEKLFGLPEHRVTGAAASELPFWDESLGEALSGTPANMETLTHDTTWTADGKAIALEVVASVVRDEVGRFIGVSLVIRNVSIRQKKFDDVRAEQSRAIRLLDAESTHLRELFKQAPGFIAITVEPRHIFEVVNEAFCLLVGDRTLVGKPAVEALPELHGQNFLSLLDQVYSSGEPYVGESIAISVQQASSGAMHELFVDFLLQPINADDGSVTGVFIQGNDVTQHLKNKEMLSVHQKHLEELVEARTTELRASEKALSRRQKLEAIGQLTGGVAHDFNNVLQIISGNLQLIQRLEEEGKQQPQLQNYLFAANDAVKRGSTLSSQLLAFARRQPLRPITVNLGRVMRRMDDLLRGALGEAIEVETVVAGGLWNTSVDPNQLENVILNFALNARDAMPNGGRLTVEIGNAMLDDRYVADEFDVPAGQYVMLAVTDTGAGMSEDVVERAFEPFFTTKKEGEGTGLGLSMAYGFAKQSGGHIRIYSEPGHGTTFKIYLPRSLKAEIAVPLAMDGPVVGGSETILVVEDDRAVRETVVALLQELGYRLLQAENAANALAILQSGASVDLLFTDVVMPGTMNSTTLAREAQALLPRLAVLFTSGYTQNAIVHGGRLDPGVELLSKPYGREELARKLRQLLPRERTVDSSHPAGEQRADPPERALHILVVEDDLGSQASICELLSVLGHQPAGVATAEEAASTLKSEKFDLLFTDVNLPGRSGVELARDAKALYPWLKVIVASGYGSTVAGLDPSFVVLPKPFDLQKLENALLKSLPEKPNLPAR